LKAEGKGMRLRRKLSMLAIAALFLAGCKFQFGVGYNQGHSPVQPIPYDHELHVTKNGIQCQFCHNQVESSRHSNIPSLQTCMKCHLTVKADSPHIQKIREAYDKGESIEWKRVHLLPDFVNFNHAAHVTKGVNCETCHGPVQTMKQVSQFSDLSMGWCINCHRQPENKAPTSCSTCHQ
jgi:hypothetical protein